MKLLTTVKSVQNAISKFRSKVRSVRSFVCLGTTCYATKQHFRNRKYILLGNKVTWVELVVLVEFINKTGN